MFDETLIDNLPDDPEFAGKKICDEFINFLEGINPNDDRSYYYEDFLKALAMLLAFSEAHNVNIDVPEISSDKGQNIDKIIELFYEARASFDHKFTVGTLNKYKKAFDIKFSKGFMFEFSEGDIKRIQTLINELRDIIAKSEELDEEHRLRLMKRLEKLQTELHKTVSDLDRFWGLLVDASVVLKKIGQNAKPIVDRIQEIVNIVWRVQARAEELPSNIPLELPSGDNEE